MDSTTETASPAETREMLLRVSGRGYTVVRHLCRQLPASAGQRRSSVLGPMVTERKRRSVQLYLLLLTVWPWLEGQDHPLPAAVWARALSTDKGRRWTPTHVSAAWTDLEGRGLITRQRLSRGVIIAPRREDGAANYTKPGLKKWDRHETFFVLPPEFWTEEWFEKLSPPGLAMMLIIAGETSQKGKDEVWLTNEDAGDWYGLSPRSVESGIEDLRKHGLLEERVEWVKAPLSAIGSTKQHHYSLTGQFSTAERAQLQKKAQTELKARLGRADGKSSLRRVRKPKAAPGRKGVSSE